jgi:hypothetical protein
MRNLRWCMAPPVTHDLANPDVPDRGASAVVLP